MSPIALSRTRLTRAGAERGAGTLEYVGVTLVASILILGVLLSPASGSVGDAFSRAICSVIERTCSVSPGSGSEAGQTPYEHATSGEYVALGDSYSSGEGAWDYEEGTDFDDRDDLWPFNDHEEDHNRCHRSENAYSQILSHNNDFAGGSTFVACSGATTEDLDNPNDSQTGEEAQLDALGEETTLVTMTMGGNDLGFADVVKDCILNGESGLPFVESCQDKHDDRIDEELPELMDELVDYYEQIQAQAPNAQVVIIGYPPLFDPEAGDSIGNLLFAEDMQWMNEQAAELNAMLAEAAEEAGVEFIDPTDAFAGHGIGGDDPWFNDLDIGGPGFSVADPSSFHPNAAGQAAIADLVQQHLENPRR
jgi:lysophospholipase L1-like esterase